jgi:hypothetical protein
MVDIPGRMLLQLLTRHVQTYESTRYILFLELEISAIYFGSIQKEE